MNKTKRKREMILNLTEQQRDYIKITYNYNRYEVNFGEKDPIHREYYSALDLINEFAENEIEKADFDDEAHHMYIVELESFAENMEHFNC
ncbi:hypothetical cytosolic protein [Syntrophus aciditrophicus SB]|uniref:Hypothetical cytosolic protein n=2 Tax=Syntrophus TaxID=43773 RepID=Q2LW26_SYNAS|nr:hypothetical cytosolic protein [Syntrophus aciditrophicus SB]